MKHLLFLISISLYLVCPHIIKADVVGSAHDFSVNGWSGGKICLPCHAPHNTNTNITAPLWNHEMSTATYTLYQSPTLSGPIDQPGSISKLCLSCHDGTVALDSFGGATGSVTISGDRNIGTDLTDDHPIGVTWYHQTIDNDTPSSHCMRCHVDIPIASRDMPLPFFEDDVDRARLECATCHEPHNNVPDGNEKMLRISIKSGSGLCLHCHDK